MPPERSTASVGFLLILTSLGLYSPSVGLRGETRGAGNSVSDVVAGIVLVDVRKFLPPGYNYQEEEEREERENIKSSTERAKTFSRFHLEKAKSAAESKDITNREIELSAEAIFQSIRKGTSLSESLNENRPENAKKIKRKRVKASTTAATISTTWTPRKSVTGWFTPSADTTISTTISTTTTTTVKPEWQLKEERRRTEARWREEGGKRKEEDKVQELLCLPGPPCRVSGALTVSQGLEWGEGLAGAEFTGFTRAAEKVELQLRRALQLGYWGSSFQYVEVEGFSPAEAGVSVKFFLELRTDQFSIGLGELERELEARLLSMGEEGGGAEGEHLYFLADSLALGLAGEWSRVEPPVQGERKAGLPDWGWLVILGGSISTAIIAVIGCTVGAQRMRESVVLRRNLNNVTLKSLKGVKSHLDLVETLDDSAASFFKDRRDMWTLQKLQQGREKSLHRDTVASQLARGGRGEWGRDGGHHSRARMVQEGWQSNDKDMLLHYLSSVSGTSCSSSNSDGSKKSRH